MTTTPRAIAERWVSEYTVAKQEEANAKKRVKTLHDKLLTYMEEEREETLEDTESGAKVRRKVGAGPASLDVLHMDDDMVLALHKLAVLSGSVTRLRGLKGVSSDVDGALARFLMPGGERVSLEIESS